jgi:hypothetical protein
VALRAADDGVDAGDQFVLVERLGEVIVGAEAEALHLVLDAGQTREDQDRRFHLGDAQGAQNLVARHVGEVQVEQDDVVIIELAEVDAFFSEIRRVDVEVLGFQHQFDALRCGAVVFDQEYAHQRSPPLFRGSACGDDASISVPVACDCIARRPIANSIS